MYHEEMSIIFNPELDLLCKLSMLHASIFVISRIFSEKKLKYPIVKLVQCMWSVPPLQYHTVPVLPAPPCFVR